MSQIHSEIAGLGLKVLQGGENVNNIVVEQRLLALQQQMHTISQTAQIRNLAFMRQTTRSNSTLLRLAMESDLLDAECDAISNYLDTQDALFSSLISQTEALVNTVEP